MAVTPLNSIAGFSVGDPANTIIQANGAITTTSSANVGSLDVTGTSNLGPVGNVKITGGSSNYVLTTDGSGNLSWNNVLTVIGPNAFDGNNIILGSNTSGSLVMHSQHRCLHFDK